MKARIILILISNMIMLTFADILSFFKCDKLVGVILRQAKINMNYCEKYARRNNNE